MITLTDQMGRQINMPFPPKRIVSLVPSQTELLYALGLTDEVVGQTLFCIHPETMHKIKPRIGGTKNVKFDKIRKLNPDLIIGNMEENEQSNIELLEQHYPVWMSNIKSLDQALNMITSIGYIVHKTDEALQLVQSIERSFAALPESNDSPSVLYLIWRKPWMAAGKDTFIGDMLQRIGLTNILSQDDGRYPTLTDEEIIALNPQLIFLSSEPYPFKERHMEEIKLLCPNANIQLVDGEFFSWYGSRLVYAADYFGQLLIGLNR